MNLSELEAVARAATPEGWTVADMREALSALTQNG